MNKINITWEFKLKNKKIIDEIKRELWKKTAYV